MLNKQKFKYTLFRSFSTTRTVRGGKLRSIHLISGCIALLLLLLIGLIYLSKYKPGDGISKLRKISAFNVDEELLKDFTRGQLCICSEQPESEVRMYPAFKSDKPIYGSIRFAEEYGRRYMRLRKSQEMISTGRIRMATSLSARDSNQSASPEPSKP